MSNAKYELSYALTNQCKPCHIVLNSTEQKFSAHQANMLSSSSSSSSTMSRAVQHPPSAKYIDPYVQRQNNIFAAVARSNRTATPMPPVEKHRLDGYTGEVRVAFGRP